MGENWETSNLYAIHYDVSAYLRVYQHTFLNDNKSNWKVGYKTNLIHLGFKATIDARRARDESMRLADAIAPLRESQRLKVFYELFNNN